LDTDKNNKLSDFQPLLTGSCWINHKNTDDTANHELFGETGLCLKTDTNWTIHKLKIQKYKKYKYLYNINVSDVTNDQILGEIVISKENDRNKKLFIAITGPKDDLIEMMKFKHYPDEENIAYYVVSPVKYLKEITQHTCT